MLNDALTIKNMTLPNRLVFPPMASGKATEDNKITEDNIKHYECRADGATLGLIIVEHSFISKEGMASPKQTSVAEDADIEGLKRLVDAVHAKGSKIVIQMNHAGAKTGKEYTGHPSIGASLNAPFKQFVPDVEMDKSEILRVEECFAKAAARAVKAGFDGVEVHSAHAYLLNQFYSPLSNLRTDEYGGSLENRLRFHVETVKAVRAEIGEEMPLFLRLGACDYMEGGNTIEDAANAAEILVNAGVDCLDISGGLCSFILKDREGVQGYFADATAAIKKRVNVPVLLTGGITTGAAAEKLLTDGAADLIGVGRALWDDPDWARKNMI